MRIKDLIEQRNNKYDLRGNDILKRPMANSSTYGLKSWRFTAPKLEETQYPIHIELYDLSRLSVSQFRHLLIIRL